MSAIIEAVKALDDAISFEESEIWICKIRIIQTKNDFMMNNNIKAQNIRYFKQQLAEAKERLISLKTRKVLITTT